MRKFAIIATLILLAVLAISLTACGTFDSDGDSDSDSGIGSGGPEQEYGLVCFDPNGETVSIAQKRYEIGEAMTDMPVPTRDGYDFVGWVTASGENYTTASTMPDLDGEILWLYPKWAVSDEMSNFYFLESPNGFTIIGIKDKTVTSIVVPDYVDEISEGAFSGCSSLESITIPFVGTNAGVTSDDIDQYPFGNIFGTTSYAGGTAVKQPESPTAMGTTYYIPRSLCSVTVTGGNIHYGAFLNCSMLTSIAIPDDVTSIGDYAFRECSSLTSINIPDGVTYIGNYAFCYCTSLIGVTFGENSKLTTIGDGAFGGCASLTSVPIPTRVTSIGLYAFKDCSSLTSVTFGENCQLETIGDYAFDGCDSLTSITIPNSVTNIGQDAFKGCSSFTSIIIPNSVTSIGVRAFFGCTSLTSIIFEDTTTWYRTTEYYDWRFKTGGTQTDVTDAATNATDLTSAYGYYWYKS